MRGDTLILPFSPRRCCALPRPWVGLVEPGTEVKEEFTVIHKKLTRNQSAPDCQKRGIMRKILMPLSLLFLVAGLPFQGYPAGPTYPISADVQTTRQRTVSPDKIPDAPVISITDVAQYALYGYSSYSFGGAVDYGKRLPDNAAVGAYNAVEPLLTYFSISDIHITDKESPAQAIYGAAVGGTWGNTNTSAYSPIILSTTHVHDAAVQTINALHKQTPFDFGLSLGDAANNSQYNELRWFVDVMDGKWITPSSGAHRGAGSIDYQRSYQSAGLDKSIPWYQVMGNHDQFWCGTLAYNEYARNILLSNTVMDMGFVTVAGAPFPTFDARGTYMGVIDGATPYGTVLYAAAADTIPAPVIAADPRRRALSTDTSTTLNWMKEFFNTTSKPKGHGFTQANLDNDFASYTFEPKASVPVKVIVLDDTCKLNPYATASSYARGCLDQERYDWLVNELELGQAQGKLMIIAAHIPVGPQLNVPSAPIANPPAPPIPNEQIVSVFLSTCHDTPNTPGVPCRHNLGLEGNDPVPPYSVVTDESLLATLHNYSNVILWMAGHRHLNTVTPQPAPLLKGPEFGFWEVETPSLRDFPQGPRTFQIVRNDNNTVSIFVTSVDPAVQGTGSPAEKSRGYAIGAHRIAAGDTYNGLTDDTSHVYNAELIKPLAAPYNITVNVTGPGAVKMGPYQAATCAVGAPCTASYLPGTQVTLAAVPTPGSGAVFAGWSTCLGTGTCNIAMTGDVAVTATFTQAPTLVVSPSYKNFGNVKTGRRAAATFTVRNTAAKGVANLTMGAIAVAGADQAPQFALVAGRDRCSGQTLATGKSCTFQVAFAPTLLNTRVATITIPSNDPNQPSVTQITGVGK
jgi:metallophosphoesterase (TIGR03768 family)